MNVSKIERIRLLRKTCKTFVSDCWCIVPGKLLVELVRLRIFSLQKHNHQVCGYSEGDDQVQIGWWGQECDHCLSQLLKLLATVEFNVKCSKRGLCVQLLDKRPALISVYSPKSLLVCWASQFDSQMMQGRIICNDFQYWNEKAHTSVVCMIIF